jgi:two-component sensor histidine kinase
VTDDVVLISSELTANAILHSASVGPGGRFAISVAVSNREYVRVEVEDQGGPRTASQRGLPDGHGLSIVAALADHWNVRGDSRGRVVSALVRWA